MSNTKDWSPKKTWRQFRLEVEAARNYPSSYALYVGQTHRHTLLEQLLPTLLYIKGACILDDSLSVWLNKNGHVLKDPYKNDLYGRISYINDNSLFENVDELHSIRKKRNSYAHEPGAKSSWEELEVDIKLIEACLVDFGLVIKTKKLEYFAERSGIQKSNDPKIAFTQRFSYGVRENGKLALEIAWNQNTLNK